MSWDSDNERKLTLENSAIASVSFGAEEESLVSDTILQKKKFL